MPSPSPHLTRRLPAEPPNVPALRHECARFAAAHCAGSRLHDVELAVAEALNNVVVHAYRDRRPPGDVRLEARLEEDRLVIEVADEGLGFGPRRDSPGAGLGMAIMRRLASRVDVECPPGDAGTVVRLQFALA